jgi:hypothetical protein
MLECWNARSNAPRAGQMQVLRASQEHGRPASDGLGREEERRIGVLQERSSICTGMVWGGEKVARVRT